jgi:hypothetical protein
MMFVSSDKYQDYDPKPTNVQYDDEDGALPTDTKVWTLTIN